MADRAIEKFADLGQHLSARSAVVELVIQALKAHQLRRIAGFAQCRDHLVTVIDADVSIEIPVKQEDGRLNLGSSS